MLHCIDPCIHSTQFNSWAEKTVEKRAVNLEMANMAWRLCAAATASITRNNITISF